jgi:hypothetical protein
MASRPFTRLSRHNLLQPGSLVREIAVNGTPYDTMKDFTPVALVTPTGTLREIAIMLNTEINKFLLEPKVKERMTALGIDRRLTGATQRKILSLARLHLSGFNSPLAALTVPVVFGFEAPRLAAGLFIFL